MSGYLYGQCMNGSCSIERATYLKNIKLYDTRGIKDRATNEEQLLDIKQCSGVGLPYPACKSKITGISITTSLPRSAGGSGVSGAPLRTMSSAALSSAP